MDINIDHYDGDSTTVEHIGLTIEEGQLATYENGDRRGKVKPLSANIPMTDSISLTVDGGTRKIPVKDLYDWALSHCNQRDPLFNMGLSEYRKDESLKFSVMVDYFYAAACCLADTPPNNQDTSQDFSAQRGLHYMRVDLRKRSVTGSNGICLSHTERVLYDIVFPDGVEWALLPVPKKVVKLFANRPIIGVCFEWNSRRPLGEWIISFKNNTEKRFPVEVELKGSPEYPSIDKVVGFTSAAYALAPDDRLAISSPSMVVMSKLLRRFPTMNISGMNDGVIKVELFARLLGDDTGPPVLYVAAVKL